MKPFSLEEYLKNPNREVVTRSGEPVRIICTDRPARQPIVALVTEEEDNYSDVRTYFANGQFSCDEKSGLDLMFGPVKHEGWINIYKYSDGVRETNGIIYSTELKARDVPPVCGVEHITTIKIEWEEEV